MCIRDRSQTNFRYDPQYGKEKRVVYLEGEAFFNVAKQKDKPFIVVVNGQEIEALGTKFNVDAYPSDSVVTTTLLEGSIRLVSEKVNTSTVLTPNQQYIYHKNKGSYKVAQVDAALYTSWISGYYYFHEENLEGILARLGNIYGVSFRICLLYTSDAADDLLCLELGCRRFIKKKKDAEDNVIRNNNT